MEILLKGLKQIAIVENKTLETKPDNLINLNVSHCAICRTDAKMWSLGHRDLHLPRVLGHEIVAEKEGTLNAIWPGVVCGKCYYCINDKENLCDNMKIIGFHLNGGFSDTISVPSSTLIPIPSNLDSSIATFAEPAGCIISIFKKMKLEKNTPLIIYGAGTLGLLAALCAKELGVKPLIIEKKETKISKSQIFSKNTDIEIVKETVQSHFKACINTCSDHTAFIMGISKAAKSAKIGFFSGLNKNEHIESNLLNLIHYKEMSLYGSYGLTKSHMISGLNFVDRNKQFIEMLIEKIIQPHEVEEVLPKVISGEYFKFIISFNNKNKFFTQKKNIGIMAKTKYRNDTIQNSELLNFHIKDPKEEIRAEAQEKIDKKTKPLGSLGVLEDLAVKMSIIKNNLNPLITNKALFVFAADHGIVEEGVSAFPQEVTKQMVENFLNGGAAINVLCNQNSIDLTTIDIGVNADFLSHPDLICRKIGRGTKNFAIEQAMSKKNALLSLQSGSDIFLKKHATNSIDILGLGEMGIGNTSSATAIISCITGLSVSECTGRGTGIDNQALEHKIKVIEKSLSLHKPDPTDALDILMKIGGYEIAGIAGAALSAAASKCAIILDGLISTAGCLIAYTIEPKIANYFIAGHKSVEIGHKVALKHMGLSPVLDLNLRLGEGSGAALSINIVETACKIMRDMASFEDAGIDDKPNCVKN